MIAVPSTVVHKTYGRSFKFSDSWKAQEHNSYESAHKEHKYSDISDIFPTTKR
jgi:hypothetical protein